MDRAFRHRFHVEAPIEAVADYHKSSQVLRRLTPPPVIVQFHSVEPLAEGSRADFTLWLGPLPVRWTAIHRDVHPRDGFTDVQAEGPFQHWVHTHSFTPAGSGGTIVSDEIHAQLGTGAVYAWVVSRMLWMTLPLLFAYRGWRTRRDLADRAPG